jgi:hypothetical protein
MAPSMPFISTSQARSCSCSSSIITNIATMAGGDRLHTPMSDDQYHIKKKIQQLLMLARVLPVFH